MQTQEALDTLNNLAYRPGWTFEAERETNPYRIATLGFSGRLKPGQDVIDFRFRCETVNTDRENAMDGYTEPLVLDDSAPLVPGDYADADELLYYVFLKLMEMELHESREFFRCKNRDWNAPFHPHREQGEQLWRTCMDRENAETN
jgi:hypothetical protein